MESDFSIRNEMDSLNNDHDPAIREVLNNYKFPPPQMGQQPPPPPAYYGSGNEAYLSNLLGQIQGGMANNAQQGMGGLQLKVDPEVLRWLLLLGFLILIVWLFMKSKQRRRNPLKRRLKRLEKQMLKLHGRKKRRKSLPQPEDDYDEED